MEVGTYKSLQPLLEGKQIGYHTQGRTEQVDEQINKLEAPLQQRNTSTSLSNENGNL